ncbi:MAG: hydantoinase/oxoprolinase family protein, partial [Alphaproteobacteria bacterium]|nr:hydantoinase/oxoprolinase family protein [Alphaproteobacteria bacterium]
MKYRIGVDIGGTFTDVVFLAENGLTLTAKLPSTPDDYSRGIADGVAAIFRDHGLKGEQVSEVLHGTTIATNAILEKKGVRTALITTDGFADVLEIRRLRMPLLYDLAWRKPATLVDRAHRFEVPERIDHQGAIERPLDEGHAARIVDRALAVDGIEAIAICLLNAYANGAHERRLRALIRERNADIAVCLSSEVLPEIKEYERTSTTVVNAYIQPVVAGYLSALEGRLRDLGIAAPILVMQSNGGAMGVAAASARPIHIIESGPAAGVVGAAEIIHRLGHADALTFDMGGTTAKASIIEGGGFNRVGALDVGGGINLSGRLLTGGGYHVRVPAI